MCFGWTARASIINTQRAFLLWAFLSSRQAIRLLDPRLYLAPLDWPFTRPMTFFIWYHRRSLHILRQWKNPKNSAGVIFTIETYIQYPLLDRACQTLARSYFVSINKQL